MESVHDLLLTLVTVFDPRCVGIFAQTMGDVHPRERDPAAPNAVMTSLALPRAQQLRRQASSMGCGDGADPNAKTLKRTPWSLIYLLMWLAQIQILDCVAGSCHHATDFAIQVHDAVDKAIRRRRVRRHLPQAHDPPNKIGPRGSAPVGLEPFAVKPVVQRGKKKRVRIGFGGCVDVDRCHLVAKVIGLIDWKPPNLTLRCSHRWRRDVSPRSRDVGPVM